VSEAFWQITPKIDQMVQRPFSEDGWKEITRCFRARGIKTYFLRKLGDSPEMVSWFIALNDKGFFRPDLNLSPVEAPQGSGQSVTPLWHALDFLVKLAASHGAEEEIAQDLLSIFRQIADYKDANGQRIENFRTDWLLTKMLFNLPARFLEEQDVERLAVFLDARWDTSLICGEIGTTGLPRIVEARRQHLCLSIIKELLVWRRSDKGNVVPRVDTYWLRKALVDNRPGVAELCGFEAADIALGNIEELARARGFLYYSHGDLNIAGEPDVIHSNSFPDVVLRFARDMLLQSGDKKPDELMERTERLIGDDLPILRRLGIYFVNAHFPALRHLVPRWPANPVQDIEVRHELYDLFDAHYSDFTEKELDTVLTWIDVADDFGWPDMPPDRKRLYAAKLKQRFLFPLIRREEPKPRALYEKYMRITGRESQPLEPWTASEAEWVGDESPFTAEELLEKQNREIVTYVNNFNPREHFGEPTESGLLAALQQAVSQKPDKFASHIEDFAHIKPEALPRLLVGLENAWKENRDFKWQPVLDFLLAMLHKGEIWQRRFNEEHPNLRARLITQAARLLHEGCRRDDHAFPSDLTPKAEEIVLFLLERTPSEVESDKDLLTHVLNSQQTYVLEAALGLSLRHARVSAKKGAKEWLPSIKNHFTNSLTGPKRTLELSVTLGKFMLNLLYLDPKWVPENLPSILPYTTDAQHWNATMKAYLYHPPVHRTLFRLLRNAGHYDRALRLPDTDSATLERAVQHVGLAYLMGEEDLKVGSSLIRQLLQAADAAKLRALVRIVGLQKGDYLQEVRPRVLKLWSLLHGILKEREHQEEFQFVISDTSAWAAYLESIDQEALDWLRLCARHIERNFNTMAFVKHLQRLAEVCPAEAGQVFLTMLKSNDLIYCPTKQADEFIAALYDHSQKAIADNICNIYGERGNYEFESLYREHSPA